MQYFTFNVYFLYLGQCRRQDALWPDSWTDSWTRKEAGLRLQRTLDQKTRVRRHLSLGQAKFSLLFASFYLADAPCLRLCGSLIIITIMLKWQNGKLCAKCIKFIANWPGQWQNRFVFVIVSVSALLAHVFFYFFCEFHASAVARIAGQKWNPKNQTRSQCLPHAVAGADSLVLASGSADQLLDIMGILNGSS